MYVKLSVLLDGPQLTCPALSCCDEDVDGMSSVTSLLALCWRCAMLAVGSCWCLCCEASTVMLYTGEPLAYSSTPPSKAGHGMTQNPGKESAQ